MRQENNAIKALFRDGVGLPFLGFAILAFLAAGLLLSPDATAGLFRMSGLTVVLLAFVKMPGWKWWAPSVLLFDLMIELFLTTPLLFLMFFMLGAGNLITAINLARAHETANSGSGP